MDINKVIDTAVGEALYSLRKPLAKAIKNNILKCITQPEPEDKGVELLKLLGFKEIK